MKYCVSVLLLLLLGGAAGESAAREKEKLGGIARKLLKKINKLEKMVKKLGAKVEEGELERLRREAEAESKAPADHSKNLKKRVFVSSQRSLQALNPEISVLGDFFAKAILRKGAYAGEDDRSGFFMRSLGLNIQSTLDPFSLAKMSVDLDSDGNVGLEEIYITWMGVIPRVNLTLGRFRQQLGLTNRWHEHDLDQFTFSLALRTLFGEGGLVGTGLSIEWLMPRLTAHANAFTLQITDGENDHVFSGKHFTIPTVIGRFKNYYDLSENTYLELGLSGGFGFNNRRGYSETGPGAAPGLKDEGWRHTGLAALDLTLNWSPLRKAKYKELIWRTEVYYVNLDTLQGTINALGGYTYLQWRLNASWLVGAGYDLTQPLMVNNGQRYLWQLAAWVTFWQSEFVFIRLQVQHQDGTVGRPDSRAILQVNFAAGPHKHEKY